MSPRPTWHGDPAPAQLRALRELAALPAGDRFTAALAGHAGARTVSAVIPTYNRCPYRPAGRLADNPLYWAVTSLRGQAGGALAEIVVVDDGSGDHTQAVLGRLAGQDHPVPVRPVSLKGHQGAWRARNAGAAAARCSLLYFADDDCVFPPHAVAGAACALALLREDDPAAAAVNTPFYYRALRPRSVLPATRIGTLDIEAATFSTGFHAMPSGYLDRPPALGPAGLLMPLRVQLIGGTALIDAAALRAAGGFEDLSSWATGYSDHLHLSADLTAAGARLYHCPDPRLGAAHLKFGADGAYPLDRADLDAAAGTLGRRFGDLVALSALPRAGSGHRVADGAFFREQIGSFFAFFAARSAAGGRAWAVRSWEDFAVAGQAPTLAVAGVPGPAERALAWREGLAAGARALTLPGRRRLDRDVVEGLLAEVSDACGQPVITGW